MEVAGLGIGLIGLIGLYSACQEALATVDSYRNFRSESDRVAALFTAGMRRFEIWAETVGIAGGKVDDNHHVELDPRTAFAVSQILSSVRDIFNETDSMSSRLQFRPTNEQLSSITNARGLWKESFTEPKRPQPSVDTMHKLIWTIKGKRKLLNQVSYFDQLVEILYKLVPLEKSNRDLESSLIEGMNELRIVLKGITAAIYYERGY
jgi:Prion-inhibition and propagation